LLKLATNGTQAMFNVERRAFCYRLRQSGLGLVQEGLSDRYTMMTLLGLHRAEASGLISPVNINAVLLRLVRDTSWVTNVGDLGLLLWLSAVVSPERLRECCDNARLDSLLNGLRKKREKRTMELAWFLSGLAHMKLAGAAGWRDEAELARSAYAGLQATRGKAGLFGHVARDGSLGGLLRGRIGSFADQVYPIYALSKYAEAYRVPDALEMARQCADQICRLQGPLGEWWWHYDAKLGRVFEGYPVYSVHQDGMAPMALFALSEALNEDYDEPIYRGLQWIGGNNQLGRDLINDSEQVIWRNIYHRQEYSARFESVRRAVAGATSPEGTSDLVVRHECRPYHFGWLLYAFAGRSISESGRHRRAASARPGDQRQRG
jgi:hypothetical protein